MHMVYIYMYIYNYSALPVVSTYNPIYGMYNPIEIAS